MKAKTLDKKFDDGKSVLKHFDLSKTTRPGLEQKRVNVDFPVWMIQRLDKETKRLGVPRQSTYLTSLRSPRLERSGRCKKLGRKAVGYRLWRRTKKLNIERRMK